MNLKPGTPFIYYAAFVPLVLAGVVALVPLLAFPFSAAPLVFVISLLFPPAGVGGLWFDEWHGGLYIPSPVLAVGHVFLFFGGRCFNKGNRALGFSLLAYASVALILYMIPVYLMAVFSWLLDSGNRTVIILSVMVPPIYIGSLVAVLTTTVRIGDSLEMGRQIPRWSFLRRLGFWSAVAAIPVVALIVEWRISTVPQHRIAIVNETGRSIYLSTVQIGDVVDDFHDSYVFPFRKFAPQMGGRRRFTVRREIFLADVKLRFRFNLDEPIREYMATIFSSWYIDCSFEITMREDRIDTSDCRTENRQEGFD